MPSRTEPPKGALTGEAAFVQDRTPARRVFGMFCFVGTTRDQLEKATLMSGNLAMWRPPWDHSLKLSGRENEGERRFLDIQHHETTEVSNFPFKFGEAKKKKGKILLPQAMTSCATFNP